MSTLYEKDFYGWCLEQSTALAEGRTVDLDIEHLKEEIESLGKGERRALYNALELLFRHLLKWEYQADYRTPSWKNTIRNQRISIKELLEESPSLKSSLQEIADKAYQKSRNEAAFETRMPVKTFPEDRNFTIEWALNFEIN